MVRSFLSPAEDAHLPGMMSNDKMWKATGQVFSIRPTTIDFFIFYFLCITFLTPSFMQGLQMFIAVCEQLATVAKKKEGEARANKDLCNEMKGKLDQAWQMHMDEVMAIKADSDVLPA